MLADMSRNSQAQVVLSDGTLERPFNRHRRKKCGLEFKLANNSQVKIQGYTGGT
jgi:hypothetical protein